jgi:hypothetical protein
MEIVDLSISTDDEADRVFFQESLGQQRMSGQPLDLNDLDIIEGRLPKRRRLASPDAENQPTEASTNLADGNSIGTQGKFFFQPDRKRGTFIQ